MTQRITGLLGGSGCFGGTSRAVKDRTSFIGAGSGLGFGATHPVIAHEARQ